MADKLTPEQVLYVESLRGPVRCANCVHFIEKDGRCELFGPDDEVSADQVCFLYVPGEPMEEGEPRSLITPEEAGLGKGGTNCGNCVFGGGDTCGHPALNGFAIDNKRGCCNAWEGKETEMKKDREYEAALKALQKIFEEREQSLKQLVTVLSSMSNSFDAIERRVRSRRRADGDYQPGAFSPGAGEGATPATTRQEADRYYRPEKFPDSGDGKEMFNGPRMDRERMRSRNAGRIDGRPIEPRKTKKHARIL